MLHDLVYSILGQAIVLAAHLKLISFRIVLVRYVAAELIGEIEGSRYLLRKISFCTVKTPTCTVPIFIWYRFKMCKSAELYYVKENSTKITSQQPDACYINCCNIS